MTRRSFRRRAAVLAGCAQLAAACTSPPLEPVGSTSPRPAAPAQSPSLSAPSVMPSGVTQLSLMSVARAVHTATQLEDGTVLIAGGFGDAGQTYASAEVYSPRTATFTPVGDMTTPRDGHTASRLQDGRVLLAGGFGGDGIWLQSAELYDPRTKAFSPTGSLNEPRADQTATLLQDGRVLIVGGVGPGIRFLSTAEVYDPATGRFTPTGSITGARESNTATLLQDGRVLVTGGHRGRHENIVLYSSAELYDPAIGRFTPTGSMTIPRHKHDAVALADGRVLILGGDDAADETAFVSAEIYDPKTGRFSPTGDMKEARYKFLGTSLLVAGDRVVVSSGAPTPEVFDPSPDRSRCSPGRWACPRCSPPPLPPGQERSSSPAAIQPAGRPPRWRGSSRSDRHT